MIALPQTSPQNGVFAAENLSVVAEAGDMPRALLPRSLPLKAFFMPRSSALLASFVMAASFAMIGASAQAQEARGTMEQCVDRVLAGLAQKKATDIEVGRAVVSQCDKQLRATLAEAIKSGEASSCTVEKCIQVARDEATRQARELYRQRAKSGQ